MDPLPGSLAEGVPAVWSQVFSHRVYKNEPKTSSYREKMSKIDTHKWKKSPQISG